MFEIVPRHTENVTLFDIVMNNNTTGDATPIVGGLRSRREAGTIAGNIFATMLLGGDRAKGPEEALDELARALKKAKAS